MSDDEIATVDEKLPRRPGVTDWLTNIVGAPRASKATSIPEMPSGFQQPAFTGQRLDIKLPDEVVIAVGGDLLRVEVRGLPKGVVLTQGQQTNEGFWLIEPSQLHGIGALVPNGITLPFSVMLKGVFCGDDPDTPWSELTGYEFAAGVPDAIPSADNDETILAREDEKDNALALVVDEAELEPESGADPVHSPEMANAPERGLAFPESMVVIDLDVSVGTDDQDVLKGILVKFSGLPNGAILNSGRAEDGVWTVAATELADLSIIIREDTADFELDVEMIISGSAPQTASIHVENSPAEIDPTAAFAVRLAPTSDHGTPRISIFADGTAIYDRVLNWSAVPGPFIEFLVPYNDNALPFEIVMRHDALGDDGSPPKLLGLDIDGVSIAADSPAISANGTFDGSGLKWHGDLIVDVRHALKLSSSETNEVPDDGELAHQPVDTIEPSAATAPDTGTAPAPQPDTVLVPATDSLPAGVNEPDVNFADRVEGDFDEADIGTVPGPKTTNPQPPALEMEDDGDTLIVDASYSDLQQSSFLKELRNLRDFIRTRPSDDSGEIYDRLGIDVTKWDDMAVRGPTGAPVDLNPLLPSLAPRGGIDNTRDFRALGISDVPDDSGAVIRITDVPPGALLTRGRNLGHGTWLLNAWETEQLAILPAIADGASMALQVGWNEDGDEHEAITPRKTLIVGRNHLRMLNRGTEMRAVILPIDPEIFDPDGHGALSLTLGEMPPGAILNHGRNHGGGVWTLEVDSGKRVSLNVAVATQPFAVTLTCVALDTATGASTVVSRVLDVVPAHSKISFRTGMAA